MIAGNATPSDARMMWKPSVNAIWLRAASTCEAARVRASVGVGATPRRPGRGRGGGRRRSAPGLPPAGRDWFGLGLGALGPVDPCGVGAVEPLRPAVGREV